MSSRFIGFLVIPEYQDFLFISCHLFLCIYLALIGRITTCICIYKKKKSKNYPRLFRSFALKVLPFGLL